MNINVVNLISSETGTMKCDKDRWKDGTIGPYEPGCERNGQRKDRQALENSERGCDERNQDTSLCLCCSLREKSGSHPSQDAGSSIVRVSCNVNACLAIFIGKHAYLCNEHARFERTQSTTSYITRTFWAISSFCSVC